MPNITPMPTDRVVLDTNSLLSSLARRGSAYPVWKGFQEGRYTLCVTTEILEEYEEVIARKTTAIVAENVLNTIPFPKLLVLKLKTFIEKLTASKE